ncbi:MAG: hypothetical protein AUH30_00905 [Candidatus Rokubacteria bacterium 13_1_40CM_68_15]|nr:MAG: hypothetical protein AUH30_00905 [Candidatus Rokubacteria bacterium 13_1_40CM_68_15]
MKGISRHDIDAAVQDAKREATSRFLSRAEIGSASAYAVSTRPQQNVVGVGLGTKITKGKVTRQRCVRFYVERKLGATAIPPEFMLPPVVNGVPTDVIETGRFLALPAAVPIEQRRLRPASPGCSIGFQFTGAKAGFVMAGTLGAVVAAGSVRYILSNNHVLADENSLPVGSAIFQPGLLDHGKVPTDEIARLTRFVPLKTGSANAIDAAIAEVLVTKSVRPRVLSKVGALKSATPVDATEGMKVHKTGRTTGYTRGSIFDVSATVKVQYDLGTLTFDDQVLIRGEAGAFSDAGDSGSLIVDRATGRATGLLFAGSARFTIANHIADVLAAFGVALVV